MEVLSSLNLLKHHVFMFLNSCSRAPLVTHRTTHTFVDYVVYCGCCCCVKPAEGDIWPCWVVHWSGIKCTVQILKAPQTLTVTVWQCQVVSGVIIPLTKYIFMFGRSSTWKPRLWSVSLGFTTTPTKWKLRIETFYKAPKIFMQKKYNQNCLPGVEAVSFLIFFFILVQICFTFCSDTNDKHLYVVCTLLWEIYIFLHKLYMIST